MLEIIDVRTDGEIAAARVLFGEYGAWLGMDMSFQGFEEEVASLPGKYAGAKGCLLLGKWDGKVAGCVGLRGFEEGVCEMKRLFVREEFRGLGVGKGLAETVVDRARQVGYKYMRLDTHPVMMGVATAIYRSLGFVEIEAYTYNPVEGVIFLELEL